MRTPNRRAFLQAGIAITLSASGPALSGKAYGQSNLADVATLDIDCYDSERQRRVPIRLYSPCTRESGLALPVFVFSHGLGGTRHGYGYLSAYLAALSWICIHVQHVGSDAAVWHGNPFGMMSRIHAAVQESEALQRVKDVRFGLFPR